MNRAAGILLHPTCFPGGTIGDLGSSAYEWVDWLVGAGQSLWQVLPLVPVSGGGSPYNGLSAFAGNPLLVSADRLAVDGFLEAADLEGSESIPVVQYPRAFEHKSALLDRAFAAFRNGAAPHLRADLAAFRERAAEWLPDYNMFAALREANGQASWSEWDPELRDRVPEALARWAAEHAVELERQEFAQWMFDRQWRLLRAYANRRGVQIIGDIPIFVAYDSADVWANQHLFDLDEAGRPRTVAGVPPDYFSETGQLWGNPLYRWDVMADLGFAWWTRRFGRMLEQVDMIRVDHFRGFEAFWEVPAGERTAVGGQWRPGPGAAVFRAVEAKLGPLPVIAEDLGLITPEVDRLRDELGFPGMRVLQFAFGDSGDENPHLPANHPRNSVAYTGTHDNDTALGWYTGAATEENRGALQKLVAGDATAADMHWHMIGLVFRSPARWAIVPLQDVLGLGSEARMNTPGVAESNWAWRVPAGALTPAVQARLFAVTRAAGRAAT